MTTSAKWRPAELRSLSRRSSTGGSTPAIAARAASCASDGVVSISTSMFERIRRDAASRTSTATKSAASESALPYPPATRARPISTATDPARSPPK